MEPLKVLIIGGTGHIGGYLAPRLAQRDVEVHVVARHPRPHHANPHLGWPAVHWIIADRTEEERTGAWLKRMRGIDVDAVVDLTCFTPRQQEVMFEAFGGRIEHFLHCGTIWAYGSPERVRAGNLPNTESKRPKSKGYCWRSLMAKGFQRQ